AAGFGVGFSLRERVRVDDGRALLALAHLPAEFGRLLVRHPDRRLELPDHGGGPEREHVDAAVGLAAVTQRPWDGPRRVPGLPRANPRPDAGLELRDDAGGDAGVDVLPRLVC